MTARRTPLNSSLESKDGFAPRLGTVIRFEPHAAAAGVRGLSDTGFRVAASSDFKGAQSVPSDFGGADVQYFERFGIAIVRQYPDRLAGYLSRNIQSHIVQNARPEREYRALSTAAPTLADMAFDPSGPATHVDYIKGYRDGVNELAERLLGEGTVQEPTSLRGMKYEESTVTWGLQVIGADVSKYSGTGIRVAVLDTGFDETHPDFRGRIVSKKLFATRSEIGDVHGHGTHCIGTACGPKAPASAPRYGVAYDAEIFAGKVLGDDGYGTDRSIIAGMDWAVEQGCQVISMSLGAVVQKGDQPTEDYEQIGRVCLDSGTIVIAAAGNESVRPGHISPVGSPANATTILAVAAVDGKLQVARFSSGGINVKQAVDIAAPGVDILSSTIGGGYTRLNGTSMATPHVAGVAALLAESNASFRGWALWARVIQLARQLPIPTRDVGKGLVQAPT